MHLASESHIPHCYASDHLGTAQMELSSSGSPIWRGEFAPFGQELSDPASTANRYKFTGKERDNESGLDYFGARYYASTVGRWMSPDWAQKAEPVPYAKMDSPQSLNLYGYVGNNPINQADADGHCPWCVVFEEVAESPAGRQISVAAGAGWAALGGSLGAVGGYILSHTGLSGPVAGIPNAFGSYQPISLSQAIEKTNGEQSPQSRGRANEAKGLSEVGAQKNTKPTTTVDPKTGKTGTTIADGNHSDGQLTEVKDTKRVTDSRQLRLQNAASKAASGKPSQVVTGTNTQVSNTVQQNHEVIRTPKLGPQ
ncbi:MAG: hypothetical protein JSS87_02235 [Acidobacteria bacterium]|nr:hypothetical protein [Acidobacteriota bacterium]